MEAGVIRQGLLAVCALLPCLARAEVAAEYLQGYARAVLDLQFPGRNIEVIAAYDDGRLVLVDGSCAPDAERLPVETAIEATQRFAHVVWQAAPQCGSAATAPAGTLAQIQPMQSDTPAAKSAQAEESDSSIEALPVDELFKPLIADPRQPQFAIKYDRYDARDDFDAASVSFGDYFGFASGLFGEYGVSQIGLQGAVFALFNLDAPSYDLVNADYWLGIPLSVRRGPLSYLTRIYHQSSHLGDEFLIGNPDIPRINLSYEDWETLTSYEWKLWRFYGGGGVILNSEPNLDPLHVQMGAEYRRPQAFLGWQFVGAADWQANQEQNWQGSGSYQMGFAIDGHANREIRFMLEHYRGYSPNGQFYNERLRYTGLGVYFDL
ncbi:MAG: DUF1207 domain-containing protein [Gammaproteobacteria bacterium]|nr:DUF1207 domain-containing protein [Gammaproteobacteria bacterium]